MSSWKRILVLGLGPGAGLVLFFVVILTAYIWYRTQPHPWNTGSIEATFSHVTLDREEGDLAFVYFLKNRSLFEYRIDESSHPALYLRDAGQELSPHERLSLSLPLEILPGSLSRLDVRWRLEESELKELSEGPDFSADDIALETWVNERLGLVGGFVVLDRRARYQIELPKGW